MIRREGNDPKQSVGVVAQNPLESWGNVHLKKDDITGLNTYRYTGIPCRVATLGLVMHNPQRMLGDYVWRVLTKSLRGDSTK